MKKFTFLFLLSGFVTFGQSFVDVTGSLPQLKNSYCAWGDYDGDGDLDLYYAGALANGNGGGLFKNDNGTFNLVTNSGLPFGSFGAADWGDVDNDGDLDIVIMTYNNTNITDVYLNNGNDTFSHANAGLLQSYYGDVKFADVNNDGNLDIGLTGYGPNYVTFTKLYLGNGTGIFNEITSLSLPPINTGRIRFADYDNDGDVDFVLYGKNDATNSTYTQIWKNNGNADFTEQNFNLPQLWLGDLEWGDVDNDGDLDLVITGTSGSNSEAHLLIYDNSSFTDDPHFNMDGAQRFANIELADFDDDGNLDIFITGDHVNGSSQVKIAKIYNNMGNHIFYENTNVTNLPAVDYGDAKAADYDNDGRVDLFITGQDQNNFGVGKLFHNGPTGSIDRALADKFNIYPNPVSNFLNIDNKEGLNFTIKLNDLTGKTVYANTSTKGLTIDVSHLPTGLYLIKINSGKNSMIKKLLIK